MTLRDKGAGVISGVYRCVSSLSNAALLTEISQITIKLKKLPMVSDSEQIEKKHKNNERIRFAKSQPALGGLCGGQCIEYPASYMLNQPRPSWENILSYKLTVSHRAFDGSSLQRARVSAHTFDLAVDMSQTGDRFYREQIVRGLGLPMTYRQIPSKHPWLNHVQVRSHIPYRSQ